MGDQSQNQSPQNIRWLNNRDMNDWNLEEATLFIQASAVQALGALTKICLPRPAEPRGLLTVSKQLICISRLKTTIINPVYLVRAHGPLLLHHAVRIMLVDNFVRKP